MMQRTIVVGDHEITYEGRVTETIVSDGSGRPGATYVCTEYVRTDGPAASRAHRPVLFVFNGGPGSASVWTHLGIGPRRIADADVLSPRMRAPFALTDNADTPLDFADLVFIDPPGTGYSRLLEPEMEPAFFGVEQDARASLEFIATWTREHHRERSPRFVLGESYGTVRAARMAKLGGGGPFLGGRTRSTSLAGAIVLGPALRFGLGAWGGRVLDAMALPSLVPTANFHRGLDGDVDAAWEFARTALVPAILAGDGLDEAERERVVDGVATFTGLSSDQVRAKGLAISPAEFARLVCADRGQDAGLYDSRYLLAGGSGQLDPVADDPGMGQYAPMFLGAIEPYLREELGYETDAEYIGIDFAGVNGKWDYGGGPGVPPLGPLATPVDAIADFAVALRRDPTFEVHIAAGDYDLVTSWAEARFAISQTPHDTSRVHLARYPSGHMPYLGAESRTILHADLAAFVGRLSA